MKKLFLTLSLTLTAVLGFSQTQVAPFVKVADATDTIYINQASIVRVNQVDSGQAEIIYTVNGTNNSAIVSGDMAAIDTAFTTNLLFLVNEVGNSDSVLINALNVVELVGNTPTTIWYKGARNKNIEVDENRAAIVALINAL